MQITGAVALPAFNGSGIVVPGTDTFESASINTTANVQQETHTLCFSLTTLKAVVSDHPVVRKNEDVIGYDISKNKVEGLNAITAVASDTQWLFRGGCWLHGCCRLCRCGHGTCARRRARRAGGARCRRGRCGGCCGACDASRGDGIGTAVVKLHTVRVALARPIEIIIRALCFGTRRRQSRCCCARA